MVRRLLYKMDRNRGVNARAFLEVMVVNIIQVFGYHSCKIGVNRIFIKPMQNKGIMLSIRHGTFSFCIATKKFEY